MDTFGNTIQLVECFTLHHITQPAAGISFFVHPRHRVWNVQLGNRFQFGNDFRRCRESNSLFFSTIRQCLQEFQNIGRQRLCHTQSRKFHKDIDNLLFLRQSINPTDIFVGKQRILAPLRVGETQADVVRQLKVTQQQLQVRIHRTVIYIVRTLPPQHMLGSFRQHTLESQSCHHRTNLVIINQAGITEYLRRLTEHLLHLGTLPHHFFLETIFVGQRRKTMRIRFSQELATARFAELTQQVYNSRRMYLQLLQCHAGDGESHFKRTSGILHHFNQGVQCRDIRAFGYIIDTGFIGIIIVVIMIGTDIKETVTFQMNNLMYFKIKTDSSHFYYCFCYLP